MGARHSTVAAPQRPVQLPSSSRCPVSVIIPALNEEGNIGKAIKSAQAPNHGDGTPAVEVIVVDGGSSDRTIAASRALGARVIPDTPRGRARQLNAGASVATGSILLFLHADTVLPAHYARLVQDALAGRHSLQGEKGDVQMAPAAAAQNPGTWGAFSRMNIQSDSGEKSLALRAVECGVYWRTRLFSLPYGDQAIFVKADAFRAMGGFKDMPFMEDYDFVKKMNAISPPRLVPPEHPVTTSARRWDRFGVLRTTLVNQVIIVSYEMGVPTEQLSTWYAAALGRKKAQPPQAK